MDTPALPPPIPAPVKDRHLGLIIFGSLEVLAGLGCALLTPLVFVGQMTEAKQNDHPFEWSLALPGLLMLGLMAVGLVWLGVGSILARRWARALLLCLSSMGLVVGVTALVAIVPLLRSMDEKMLQQGQQVPPGMLLVVKIIAAAMVFIMYVVCPGALVLFYRSRHVKQTCEVRDPVERWTDRCPLPVLALCLLQVAGSVSVLALPGSGAVFPLFGYLATGWAGRVLMWGFAVFSLYAARGFYRLNRGVWLAYMGTMITAMISMAVTFLVVGLPEYYRASGLPEWQLEQVLNNPLIHSDLMVAFPVVSGLAYLGYLIWLRRFFPVDSTRPASA